MNKTGTRITDKLLVLFRGIDSPLIVKWRWTAYTLSAQGDSWRVGVSSAKSYAEDARRRSAHHEGATEIRSPNVAWIAPENSATRS